MKTLGQFQPMYPDVLGAITDSPRIRMEALQCALGIFPSRTYINQPVELVLILQNMVDQNMQVKVGIQVPTEDKKGRPVVMDTPRKTLSFGLRPGEVGVLRTPIVPRPPTPPGPRLPVRVAVRYRTPSPGNAVRPPSGGPPPNILSISSFKLQALRDVQFSAHTWNQSTDIITTYFDLAPKIMPDLKQEMKPRYETLWTPDEMLEEREMIAARTTDARRLASSLTRTSIYAPLLMEVTDRFGERDMPLHPGEAKAIAKMMTYAIDEGMELEPDFEVETSRWFQTLCQVLAHDDTVEDWDRGTLVIRYLFEATLFDAIMLGFGVVQPKIRDDLGSRAERTGYANRVLNWLAGQGGPDVSYVYLPLVMGGVVVNQFVTLKSDNPWIMLDELRDALRGRSRLFSGETSAIYTIMADLLVSAEDSLRQSHVPRR